MVFNEDGDWNVATFVMIAVTFLGVFVYDALMKAMKGNMASIIIGLVLTGVILVGMSCWANFSYRGYNIHIGAMFGTIMAFNVWYRIWPAQQKIITAIKNGEAPPADLAALAGLRSKHNTYLSVPLFWTMINQHTTFFSGGNWGIPGHYAWAVLLVITVIGWHMVKICYKKGAKVRGF
jgi:uncharacterized membrane protein